MSSIKTRELEELSRIKGGDRILVNTILSAVCVGVLPVLLALSPGELNGWIIGQLAVAIPCLITSSLAYAKIGYRAGHEYPIWDNLGWVTHSIGYIMILNATAILLNLRSYRGITWGFIGATIFLFLTYSALDVIAKKSRLKEKGLKLAFYLLGIFAGSVFPILIGWA